MLLSMIKKVTSCTLILSISFCTSFWNSLHCQYCFIDSISIIKHTHLTKLHSILTERDLKSIKLNFEMYREWVHAPLLSCMTFIGCTARGLLILLTVTED